MKSGLPSVSKVKPIKLRRRTLPQRIKYLEKKVVDLERQREEVAYSINMHRNMLHDALEERNILMNRVCCVCGKPAGGIKRVAIATGHHECRCYQCGKVFPEGTELCDLCDEPVTKSACFEPGPEKAYCHEHMPKPEKKAQSN